MSPVEDEQGPLVGGPEVGDIYSVGTDFCFRMPDLRRLDEEVDELKGSGVPTTRRTSACASEKKSVRGAAAAAALPVKQVTAEVRRVTLKRNSVSLENRGSKKRRSREHECKLCSTGTFIFTPVRRHAVRHHLPWFLVPDTACWTCKRQYGSSGQLKKHVDEERIKSDLDPHVDQEPHQMFGQEHVVEWCELGFGFVQQVADQTANGSLEGLLDWVKVCVTNKSEVELHMLDRELLSAFCVFLENLPRKEELSALLGWRMVYSIMQVLAAEGSTIGEVPRKPAPGGKVWHPSSLLPSVQAMYDGHSHLDRWSVEVGKREARERLAAMPYETVTSYCFSKWWLDSKRQDWWPTSRGPLKQAFGVHPTEASDMGLTHRKYEDLKRYVQGVNCVAVGEIGLDHVRVRQDKGRDQQAEVFSRVCRLAKEVGKPVVIHCRGTESTAKECLWIMKSNLPKDQMVYWHHFNETEEMAREVEAAFPNVVFGVAPAILKEQLDDQLEKFIRSTSPERLMAESDAPMVGERRATNHPWAAGTVWKRIAAIKGVPLPIMRNICQSSFRRLFGHAK